MNSPTPVGMYFIQPWYYVTIDPSTKRSRPIARQPSTSGHRAPVAFRVVLTRLNRRLRRENLTMRRPRGALSHDTGGDAFFMVDTRNGVITETGITAKGVVKMARAKGAIQVWEEVER